ncbi:MAG: hypothetical protein ACUZ8H_01465 [Candidatus Anammoxibacter sp.]
MKTKEATATVKATGQWVNVYKSSINNEWIVFPACSKAYKPNELEFDK